MSFRRTPAGTQVRTALNCKATSVLLDLANEMPREIKLS